MPRTSSPFIPPMPSPYGTQGVIPSPLSADDSLASEQPSQTRRGHPGYPYPIYGPHLAPAQWTPSGQWGPPGMPYGHPHGLTPAHMYAGTPWTAYQQPGYGPHPPHIYGFPSPGHPHPHSAPYPLGPLPGSATPYNGAPFYAPGYPGPYMPGSVPMGPSSLHPGDVGPSFSDGPNEDIIGVTKWTAGSFYAPVLSPFQLSILDATLTVNPLLSTRGDNPPPDQPFLEYNVLLPVRTAHRSTDPSNKSWSIGRHTPATSPRVSLLRIVSREFPWILEIEPARPQHGVTCLDVLEGIYEQLQDDVSSREFHALADVKGDAYRRKMYATYHYNRSTARDAPGGSLGVGARRGDCLLDNVMFDGLVCDPQYVQDKLGISGPGWKGLKKPVGEKERGKMLQTWPATVVLKLDQRYSNWDMDRDSVVTDDTQSSEVTQT